jgi:xanthine dehydrogenase accessory factor
MDIIADIAAALKDGERVALATLIASSGSSPLSSGAMMVIRQRSRIVRGTIGGGLLEASVMKELEQFAAEGDRFIIRSVELNDTSSGEGMICGGTVQVLIEHLGESALSTFARLAEVKRSGADGTLLRHLESASGSVHRFVSEHRSNEVDQGSSLEGFLQSHEIAAAVFLQVAQRAHREETVARLKTPKGELIIQPIAGVQPVIIFCGGHIGRSLSNIASAAGFVVTVVDDREEYADRKRFPEATRTLAKSWSEAFAELEIGPSASIVIVTRGHESDAEVLRHAITTPARYVGMIGSGMKVAATYKKLLDEGVPRSSLERVHAPIGLDIGAMTAEEIAVSIVAELIRSRRGHQGDSKPLSRRMKTWFEESGI